MEKYKIICVDDDVKVLPVYEMMLGGLGFEVVTINSCIEALSFIKEHAHNIIFIFSDYRMEEMSGLEFRKQVNELGSDIPFALVTGFYDLEMSKSAMSLGISTFIEKPFDEKILKKVVGELGEKRKNYLDEEREMVISFIEESYPMLFEVENLIMSLESEPDNVNYLNTYFRLLHTIKGTASCVGLKNIPKFAHKYEDLVVKLQSKQTELTEDVANVLLRGLDQLKLMYAEAQKGNFEIEIEQALEIFNLEKRDHSKVIVSSKGVPAPKKTSSSDAPEINDDKIAISIDVLNNFMELSGQLTVIRNTLIKSAVVLGQRYHGDSELEIMIDSLEEMHKVSSIFQNDISEMRKISLEAIYKPLRRVIRDSSKSLNKMIDFQVDGDSLRVDTVIGKVLSNSLVHMIRNSIDHGIEAPDVRVLAGKSSTGTIKLKSYQEGENIVVQLSDDGGGLSLSRIKQKALEKKIFTEDQLKQMSDQKIFSIIFDSGFSTAQQVSDISGRGVGMDMVRSSIESTGGKILIDSKEGQGTCFTLSLPIPRSVLIIKSLMIKSKDAIFSIPLDEVVEVVQVENYKSSQIFHNIERSLMINHHDELVPLIDLREFLTGSAGYEQCESINIVIVLTDKYKFGVIVDEILDIEEIVVKKMSGHFKNASSFMGVTFLGHGALALILNLESIAVKSQILGRADDVKARSVSNENHVEPQEFMQFNLKKSKNYAFPLHIVNRLEEFSSEIIEFSGDIPLVRYRGEVMPLLFIERQLQLCAIENQLHDFYPENLRVIVVNYKNKHFGIVIDEIMDIGITTDIINTDNIDRAGVLGTIFIAQNTVTLIDVHYLIDTHINFEKNLNNTGKQSVKEVSLWNEDEAA